MNLLRFFEGEGFLIVAIQMVPFFDSISVWYTIANQRARFKTLRIDGVKSGLERTGSCINYTSCANIICYP